MAQLNYINGEWVEKYQPTMDDLFILRGADSNDKSLLLDKIKTPITPAQVDIIIATELYENNFPEGYDFISCSIDTSERSGLINCRINEKHKQVRF